MTTIHGANVIWGVPKELSATGEYTIRFRQNNVAEIKANDRWRALVSVANNVWELGYTDEEWQAKHKEGCKYTKWLNKQWGRYKRWRLWKRYEHSEEEFKLKMLVPETKTMKWEKPQPPPVGLILHYDPLGPREEKWLVKAYEIMVTLEKVKGKN